MKDILLLLVAFFESTFKTDAIWLLKALVQTLRTQSNRGGIGRATLIERAEVIWPSGRKEVFANLKANQVIVLEEGEDRETNSKAAKPKSRGRAK